MKIRVKQQAEETELQVTVGARLLDYLQSEKIFVNAACGGKGTCHKCRVRLTEGFLPATTVDQKAFTELQLKDGWRLSCQARPKVPIAINLPTTMNRNQIRIKENSSPSPYAKIVCDLGSTGVVLALVDDGKIAWEAHSLNSQVLFGADVMTRLNVAQNRGVEVLQKSLLDLFEKLLAKLPSNILSKEVFVSGNSAMISFLLGLNIDKLAVDPYQPATIDVGEIALANGFVLKTLPLLGGFVGGDTYSGILTLESKNTPTPWMLVDIGTNTEIVLKRSSGEYFFASAPAGPAFEGGNIAFGMRAENGAIERARFENGKWTLSTIGGDLPIGVCGSGLFEILNESIKAKLVQSDGFVPAGQVELSGEVMLMADDVREFQLAKSATRTGIEVVMNRAGERPKKIFLAGNFAEHLDLTAVRELGLIPKEIEAVAIGNASLKGVSVYAGMSEVDRGKMLERVRKGQKQIELALQSDFQELFVKNLELR